MIIFFFVNFVAVSIFDNQGLRSGILLGSVLTTIGLSLMCLINESLLWGVIGHLIVALAWPFLWNVPASLTTHWFNTTHSQRALATCFSMVGSFTGLFLGYLIPGLFSTMSEKAIVA